MTTSTLIRGCETFAVRYTVSVMMTKRMFVLQSNVRMDVNLVDKCKDQCFVLLHHCHSRSRAVEG